ncbi:MAG: class I SAM-dependent methyltransferase [Candidatus Eremiobacteraeota bacterium]|nr:class I SAM-dependent methyltransferase [Candidatus Eremiobacteraeota bacterium]
MNSPDNRWRNYFLEHTGRKALLQNAYEHWSFRWPAYEQIFRRVPPGSRILDVGCGIGFSAILLAGYGYKAVGVDNDETIIEEARTIGSHFNSDAVFEVRSAFELDEYYDQFDMTISFGVVEHFDRETTIGLLGRQARCAPFVLATIPTAHSSDPITDERLYTTGAFGRLFFAAGLKTVAKFTLGDAGSARVLKHLLPPVLYRAVKAICSYAPGIGIVGQRNQ